MFLSKSLVSWQGQVLRKKSATPAASVKGQAASRSTVNVFLSEHLALKSVPVKDVKTVEFEFLFKSLFVYFDFENLKSTQEPLATSLQDFLEFSPGVKLCATKTEFLEANLKLKARYTESKQERGDAKQATWFCGVKASIEDFESFDRGSIPRRTSFYS